MIGKSSSCFVWSQAAQEYTVLPGLHVPYLSQSSLASVLSDFSRAGTQLAWLKGLATQASTQDHVHPGRHQQPVQVVRTLQAFLQAVDAQVQHLLRPFISLQQANMQSSSSGALSISILSLSQQCAAPMRRLQLLHDVVRHVLAALSGMVSTQAAASSAQQAAPPGSQAPETSHKGQQHPSTSATSHGSEAEEHHQAATLAALQSARLLDILYDDLLSATMESGPEGQARQQVMLHLFVSSLAPLLESLQCWLFEGREDAFAQDFFIAVGKQLPETHPHFWRDAYKLLVLPGQEQSSSSATSASSTSREHAVAAACPCFLQGMARDIFSAGRTLVLDLFIAHCSMSGAMSATRQHINHVMFNTQTRIHAAHLGQPCLSMPWITQIQSSPLEMRCNTHCAGKSLRLLKNSEHSGLGNVFMVASAAVGSPLKAFTPHRRPTDLRVRKCTYWAHVMC